MLPLQRYSDTLYMYVINKVVYIYNRRAIYQETVGDSLRVLRLLPPLKLVAMI